MNTMEIVPQFTEQEKRFLLAEVIKHSSLPLERLLPVFHDIDVQPDWRHMLLPHGRNLQSCLDAFEALRPSQSHHIYQPYQIPNTALSHKPTKRRAAPEPLDSTGAKKRQPDTHILPKPPNGGSPGVSGPSSATIPKKRGRPSKAIVEQRQAELIRRGQVIPPATSTPKPDYNPHGEASSTPGYTSIAPMRSTNPTPSPLPPVMFEPPQNLDLDVPEKGKKRALGKAAPKSKVSKPGEHNFAIINQNPEPSPPSRPVEKTESITIASIMQDPEPASQPIAPSQAPPSVQGQVIPPAATQAPS